MPFSLKFQALKFQISQLCKWQKKGAEVLLEAPHPQQVAPLLSIMASLQAHSKLAMFSG